jgi:hypothetical protein
MPLLENLLGRLASGFRKTGSHFHTALENLLAMAQGL